MRHSHPRRLDTTTPRPKLRQPRKHNLRKPAARAQRSSSKPTNAPRTTYNQTPPTLPSSTPFPYGNPAHSLPPLPSSAQLRMAARTPHPIPTAIRDQRTGRLVRRHRHRRPRQQRRWIRFQRRLQRSTTAADPISLHPTPEFFPPVPPSTNESHECRRHRPCTRPPTTRRTQPPRPGRNPPNAISTIPPTTHLPMAPRSKPGESESQT